MGQKSAHLPNFENVQYPKEESKQKHFFAKVITEVAKVYLCEKKIGGFVALKRCHWEILENRWGCTSVCNLAFAYTLLGHVYSSPAKSIKHEDAVRCEACFAATKRNNKTERQVHYFSLT